MDGRLLEFVPDLALNRGLDIWRIKGEYDQVPLVGIARFAAESSLLEAKSVVEYREIETRSWIGRCSSTNKPFDWTINPYRGCEIACKYCYARYTHEFMDLSPGPDFETKIFAKHWSASSFASELARIPRGETIAIGTATDPYQPAERRYGLTRKMLEMFAKDYGRSIYLTTKSDLVQRDIDLFVEMGRRNRVGVTLTITTTNEELARLIEPRAPRPSLRLKAVQALADAGVRTGVSLSPVIPGLTDALESLESVVAAAARAGARSVWANPVFLKPCSYGVFLPFLRDRFPDLVARFEQMFANQAYLSGAYPQLIEGRAHFLRTKYGLQERPSTKSETLPGVQIPLFAA